MMVKMYAFILHYNSVVFVFPCYRLKMVAGSQYSPNIKMSAR